MELKYSPVLIEAPADDVVSLAEAKSHCRVDHAEDDALIQALIHAAVSHLDGWTGVLGRALVTQKWRQDFDRFADVMPLPFGPVASIDEVAYPDSAGVAQSLDADHYVLLRTSSGCLLAPATGMSWPAVDGGLASIRVSYTAGQPPGEVPPAIRQAILLMVGDWYRHRETAAVGAQSDAIPMSITVRALLAPHRRSIG